MAGYSARPLAEKLGIKAGHRVRLVHAPAGFRVALAPPAGARINPRDEDSALDVVLLFCRSAAELEKELTPLLERVAQAGMIWVAWPKRASGVATDLTEDVVRRVALAAGWVDVKVCAIDETWSGLKLVRRLKDRKPEPRRTAGRR